MTRYALGLFLISFALCSANSPSSYAQSSSCAHNRRDCQYPAAPGSAESRFVAPGEVSLRIVRVQNAGDNLARPSIWRIDRSQPRASVTHPSNTSASAKKLFAEKPAPSAPTASPELATAISQEVDSLESDLGLRDSGASVGDALGLVGDGGGRFSDYVGDFAFPAADRLSGASQAEGRDSNKPVQWITFPVTTTDASDRLPRIAAGSTIEMLGQDLGSASGRARLQFKGFGLDAKVLSWEGNRVTLTLPELGVNAPIPAELQLIRADGGLDRVLPLELVAAQ